MSQKHVLSPLSMNGSVSKSARLPSEQEQHNNTLEFLCAAAATATTNTTSTSNASTSNSRPVSSRSAIPGSNALLGSRHSGSANGGDRNRVGSSGGVLGDSVSLRTGGLRAPARPSSGRSGSGTRVGYSVNTGASVGTRSGSFKSRFSAVEGIRRTKTLPSKRKFTRSSTPDVSSREASFTQLPPSPRFDRGAGSQFRLSTRSRRSMAGVVDSDGGYSGSCEGLRASPPSNVSSHSSTRNRSGTPNSNGATAAATQIKLNAKPKALSLTKTIGQSNARVKFYRSGDYYFQGVSVLVSHDRFSSMENLYIYLTRRLTEDADCIRSGSTFLPRGVRSIHQFSLQPQRADENEDPEHWNTGLNTSINSVSSSVSLTQIVDVGDFKPHYTYLCSSSTGAGSTERKTVKALQANQSKPIQKFSTQTAHHVRAILNGPKTNPMLVRDAPINRDFIKPRTVFLVKPGPRPREVKRFLLTARTAHSFEQLLDDFNDQLGGLLHGPVNHLYNLKGEKVTKLNEFFLDSKVFLVYSKLKGPYSFTVGHTELTNTEENIINNRSVANAPRESRPEIKRTKSASRIKPSLKLRSRSQRNNKQKERPARTRARASKSVKPEPRKKQATPPPQAVPAEAVSLFDNLPLEIERRFELIRNIGIGNFAEVRVVRDRNEYGAMEMALKAVDKNKRLSPMHDIRAEADILAVISKFEHSNIVYMHQFWEFNNRLFLLLDYIPGGDLFDVIARRRKFSEDEAIHMMKDLLRALRFLHSHNICHRDIKPENCLLYFKPNVDNEQDILESTLKLTDFGLATYLCKGDTLTMICGSPTYVAPEIIAQDGLGYGMPVDMWAVGVIAYILVVGMPPFQSPDGSQETLFDAILNGAYQYPRDVEVSRSARHFVDQLLRISTDMRLTSEESLKHAWISSRSKNSTSSGNGQQPHAALQYHKSVSQTAHQADPVEITVFDPHNTAATSQEEQNGEKESTGVTEAGNDDLIMFAETPQEVLASRQASSQLTLSNFSSDGVEMPASPTPNGGAVIEAVEEEETLSQQLVEASLI